VDSEYHIRSLLEVMNKMKQAAKMKALKQVTKATDVTR
jgi:hypothetical protein